MQTLLVGLIVTVITIFVTSILTYYFTSKAQKDLTTMKFKEEKYAKLLNLLEGFVGITANGETKRAFFKELHESWLYCSDDVTIAINDMVALVKNSKGKSIDPKRGRLVVGNIVLEMRKDLLGKTKLVADDFEYIDVIDSSE